MATLELGLCRRRGVGSYLKTQSVCVAETLEATAPDRGSQPTEDVFAPDRLVSY
jgi:hypothetical protein